MLLACQSSRARVVPCICVCVYRSVSALPSGSLSIVSASACARGTRCPAAGVPCAIRYSCVEPLSTLVTAWSPARPAWSGAGARQALRATEFAFPPAPGHSAGSVPQPAGARCAARFPLLTADFGTIPWPVWHHDQPGHLKNNGRGPFQSAGPRKPFRCSGPRPRPSPPR